MKKALVASGALALLVMLLGGRALFSPTTQPATGDSNGAAATAAASTPQPVATVPARATTTVDELLESTSLRGTVADGEITVDNVGKLQLTPGLRRYFDYWLGLIGERTTAQIVQLASADLASRVPPEVAREVLKALTSYLDYLEREARANLSADLDQRHAELKSLRREVLGEALASAFFGAEERDTDLLLARRQILLSTPPALQPQALAALEKTRDLAAASARLESTLQIDVEAQTQTLDAARSDAATRLAARTALVGADAAERLAALDVARAQWDTRFAAFRAQRAQIQNNAALLPAQREAMILALVQRGFSEPERRRISALDAIEAGTSPP